MSVILRTILIALPILLPAYVIRFRLGPLPTTVLEIGILAALVSWTFVRKTEGWKNAFATLKEKKWMLPLALWMIVGIIAAFTSPDLRSGFGLWRAYFLEPALVFVMLIDLLQTDRERKLFLTSLIATLVGITAWAILQRIGILQIPSPWHVPPSGIRATGPFPFPNALALFAVPIAAYCFHAAVHRRKIIHSALFWTGYAAGWIACILSKSDGGLIALAAASGIVLLQTKWRWLVLAGGTIAVSIALIIPSTRAIVIEKAFFKEWSGKVRLVMWGETTIMLRDRPILGAGLGGYPKTIVPYHKATWMEIFQYPHNILLNFWSETGLIGILTFGLIGYRWIRNRPSAALPIMTAIVIHGLVDVPYFKNDLAVMFWMFVAVMENEN